MLRRQKIAAVSVLSGRPLILYGTACTTPGKTVPNMLLMIEPGDKAGFDEVTRNVPGPALTSQTSAGSLRAHRIQPHLRARCSDTDAMTSAENLTALADRSVRLDRADAPSI